MGDHDDAWDIVTSPCFMSRGEERIFAAGWVTVVNYIRDYLPKEYAMFFAESGAYEDPRAPARVDLCAHKSMRNPVNRDELQGNNLQSGIEVLFGAMRNNISDVDVQEYASLVVWNLLHNKETMPSSFDLGGCGCACV